MHLNNRLIKEHQTLSVSNTVQTTYRGANTFGLNEFWNADFSRWICSSTETVAVIVVVLAEYPVGLYTRHVGHSVIV